MLLAIKLCIYIWPEYICKTELFEMELFFFTLKLYLG